MSPFFFVAALLLSIQCMSLFCPIIYIPHHSIYSFFLELCSLRRGSRKIHHTWRTQKEWWELLYLKQHHVTYSVQCIHHFYVLAHMWCSAFFFLLSHSFLLAIAESISNQSFFPHTSLSPSTTL